jgi:Hypothetical protein (DUF2513)
MKRDMELIRELLLAIEANVKNTTFPASQLNLESTWAEDNVYYHLELMTDAGFVEAETVKSQQRIHDVLIKRMTWEGHEFLDSARNESIWKETMGLVQQKGGSVAIGVLTQLLTSVAKQHFGLN